jgi:Tetratricopeptide repeat
VTTPALGPNTRTCSPPNCGCRGPDRPSTLATRHQIAREVADRGDHAGAEAEYQDVLDAKLRVLGPDHPSTLATSDWVAYLAAQQNT